MGISLWILRRFQTINIEIDSNLLFAIIIAWFLFSSVIKQMRRARQQIKITLINTRKPQERGVLKWRGDGIEEIQKKSFQMERIYIFMYIETWVIFLRSFFPGRFSYWIKYGERVRRKMFICITFDYDFFLLNSCACLCTQKPVFACTVCVCVFFSCSPAKDYVGE